MPFWHPIQPLPELRKRLLALDRLLPELRAPARLLPERRYGALELARLPEEFSPDVNQHVLRYPRAVARRRRGRQCQSMRLAIRLKLHPIIRGASCPPLCSAWSALPGRVFCSAGVPPEIRQRAPLALHACCMV